MKNILYVIHSGTEGGTFLTNKDLMKNVSRYNNVFLLSAEPDYLRLFRYADDNLTLIKEYARFKEWSIKYFHDSWLSYIYFDILNNFKIDLVHIRHLLNHSFDLPQIAKKLDIPVILSFHDFYFICPFYILLDENKHYCKGICNNNNMNCYNPLRALNDINSKEFISTWRREVSHLFRYVDFFVTTSNIVKELFLSIYPDMNKKLFKVIEHGRDFPKLSETYFEVPSNNQPIKILCPSNHLNLMKGSEVIKKIKKEDKNNRIEFHFLGTCYDNLEEYGIDHGRYKRDDFYKKVMEIKPSFVGIFSIWPETFCHTITEAWSCGLPVIGSNIGVIEDRIEKEEGGWIIDIDNPKKSYEKILEISEDVQNYKKIQKNISDMKLKTTKEMANEYLMIYNLVMDNFHKDSKLKVDYQIIKESGFFDENFYIKNYLNESEDVNPIVHFLKKGVFNNFNPSPNFDVEWYLNEYDDVKKLGLNPLIHYIKYGVNELKIPKLFNINEIFELALNKTLKGRKDYLFLINDSNNELKQHYDKNYNNKFNANIFSNDYHFKKDLFNKYGIDYYYFDVPDKSVICRDYLPFKIDSIKRNIESVDEIIDFKDKLNNKHYYKWDSHMNYKGGKELAFFMLNYINNSFSMKKYNELIENADLVEMPPNKDLLASINWSYSESERINLIKRNYSFIEHRIKPKNIVKLPIPKDFIKFGKRDSFHVENKNSFSDLRVLIFRDSSFSMLAPFFALFFREMFIYWDHCTTPLELIQWYKPDMILEIRIERFFEDYIAPQWVIDKKECNL